ncbi:MAG: ArsA family ATPase [Deferribacteres bacterium]|nr:ArsA family ATPase [Deferribacteres bacterium]
MKKLFIFLGKGGVGKTTSSAALAFWLAERGKKVFWFSVDPAHNIGDLLGETELSRPKKVYRELYAQEVDVDRFLEDFLSEVSSRMKSLYRHLKVSGLEDIFDVMKLSPGMEESAILYAIHDRLTAVDADYVVIDTPPTGLTLRILALPTINIKWIEALKRWRLKILDRRSMVAHIKGEDHFGGAPVKKEDDRVLAELDSHLEKMRFLEDVFSRRGFCVKILVLNPDKLSIREGLRIKETLARLKMGIDLVLVNKWGLSGDVLSEIEKAFPDTSMFTLPFIEGKAALSKEELLFLAGQWADKVL